MPKKSHKTMKYIVHTVICIAIFMSRLEMEVIEILGKTQAGSWLPLKEGVCGGSGATAPSTVQCNGSESGLNPGSIISKLCGLGQSLTWAASFVKRGVIIQPNPCHVGRHVVSARNSPLPLPIKLPKEESSRQSFLALSSCENYFS